ncbi:MAG: tetratricopeptide repeat protein [Deltaproteobacteria bacterium]|nr:MAG: tetratricopeptide repeat protein [Deltaproteobacteria bacterium]
MTVKRSFALQYTWNWLLVGLMLCVGSVVQAAPAPRSKAPKPAASKKAKARPAPQPTPASRKTAANVSQNKQAAMFRQANQLYTSGQYREATELFLKLLPNTKWANFGLFYNLGNCYFRLQSYGLALVYYRKAQRLQPNHLHLLHNIQLIFRRLGKTEPRDNVRVKFLFWYYLLNLKQIFYVVIGFTSLFLLFWGVYIRRSVRGLRGMKWPLTALGTLTVVLWLSLGIKLYQERVRTQGVITQNVVTVRSGYGDQFEPLFKLTVADEVAVKEKLEVTTPNGKQTWLKVEAVLTNKDGKTKTRKQGWLPAQALQTI